MRKGNESACMDNHGSLIHTFNTINPLLKLHFQPASKQAENAKIDEKQKGNLNGLRSYSKKKNKKRVAPPLSSTL